MMELPHTRGCLVCGRENPHGLHLHLYVDEQSGQVSSEFVTGIPHIGFEGIIHGGVLATVLDEAMVWAATWAARRFCVAGEMNVRFRQSAGVAQRIAVQAKVTSVRSRLLEADGLLRDPDGKLIAEATGKYVPVPPDRNRQFIATLVSETSTAAAHQILQHAAGAV